MMKKIFALAMSAVMLLALGACGQAPKSESNSTQLANPFTDCETKEAAEELAGFKLELPDEVDGAENRSFRVSAEAKLIEVIYQNGDKNTVCVRKAEGSGDISGDFNSYSESDTVTINDIEVSVKGDSGKISLATWTDNGYTYSVKTYPDSELSNEAITDLIEAVK